MEDNAENYKPEIILTDEDKAKLDGAEFIDGVAGQVSGLWQGQELWIKGEEYYVWEYRCGFHGHGSGRVEGPYSEAYIDEVFPWLRGQQ